MVKHRKQKCVGWCGAGEVGLMDVVVVLLLENFWANNENVRCRFSCLFFMPLLQKKEKIVISVSIIDLGRE